eukprot:13776688-Ditylum_brightwellii.AAC.1
MLNIQQHQFQDLPLNAMQHQYPQQYPVKTIEGRPLICYKERPHDPAGANRLYDTIRARFRAPGLREKCVVFKCADCQCNV